MADDKDKVPPIKSPFSDLPRFDDYRIEPTPGQEPGPAPSNRTSRIFRLARKLALPAVLLAGANVLKENIRQQALDLYGNSTAHESKHDDFLNRNHNSVERLPNGAVQIYASPEQQFSMYLGVADVDSGMVVKEDGKPAAPIIMKEFSLYVRTPKGITRTPIHASSSNREIFFNASQDLTLGIGERPAQWERELLDDLKLEAALDAYDKTLTPEEIGARQGKFTKVDPARLQPFMKDIPLPAELHIPANRRVIAIKVPDAVWAGKNDGIAAYAADRLADPVRRIGPVNLDKCAYALEDADPQIDTPVGIKARLAKGDVSQLENIQKRVEIAEGTARRTLQENEKGLAFMASLDPVTIKFLVKDISSEEIKQIMDAKKDVKRGNEILCNGASPGCLLKMAVDDLDFVRRPPADERERKERYGRAREHIDKAIECLMEVKEIANRNHSLLGGKAAQAYMREQTRQDLQQIFKDHMKDMQEVMIELSKVSKALDRLGRDEPSPPPKMPRKGGFGR